MRRKEVSAEEVEARAEILSRLRPRPMGVPRLAHGSAVWSSLGAGAAGGAAMAVPLVVYNWVRDAHSALEFPMAVTGWVFLGHFEQNAYRWWPIVVGALLALAYALVHGAAFGRVAEHVWRVRRFSGTAGAGLAWSLASFVAFWYVLLPIARDGAPFRETAAVPGAVAPHWLWLVAFVAFGLATSLVWWGLRRSSPAERRQ